MTVICFLLKTVFPLIEDRSYIFLMTSNVGLIIGGLVTESYIHTEKFHNKHGPQLVMRIYFIILIEN